MQHARPNFLYYREPLELGLKGGSSTPVTTWPSSTVLKKVGPPYYGTGESNALLPTASKTVNTYQEPLESINPAIRRRLEVAVR